MCNIYQHCSAYVILVTILCDKDVNVNNLVLILGLDITNDVSEPLKLLLTSTHPQEVHLQHA